MGRTQGGGEGSLSLWGVAAIESLYETQLVSRQCPHTGVVHVHEPQPREDPQRTKNAAGEGAQSQIFAPSPLLLPPPPSLPPHTPTHRPFLPLFLGFGPPTLQVANPWPKQKNMDSGRTRSGQWDQLRLAKSGLDKCGRGRLRWVGVGRGEGEAEGRGGVLLAKGTDNLVFCGWQTRPVRHECQHENSHPTQLLKNRAQN